MTARFLAVEIPVFLMPVDRAFAGELLKNLASPENKVVRARGPLDGSYQGWRRQEPEQRLEGKMPVTDRVVSVKGVGRLVPDDMLNEGPDFREVLVIDEALKRPRYAVTIKLIVFFTCRHAGPRFFLDRQALMRALELWLPFRDDRVPVSVAVPQEAGGIPLRLGRIFPAWPA